MIDWDKLGQEKRYDSAVSIAFTVLHDNEEPTYEEIMVGLKRAMKMFEDDHGELHERADVYDTVDTREQQ